MLFSFPLSLLSAILRVWFDLGFQKRPSFGENGHPSGDGDLWLGGDVLLHCDDTRGDADVKGDRCGKAIFSACSVEAMIYWLALVVMSSFSSCGKTIFSACSVEVIMYWPALVVTSSSF